MSGYVYLCTRLTKCKQNPMEHQLMYYVYYFTFASEKLTHVRQNLKSRGLQGFLPVWMPATRSWVV